MKHIILLISLLGLVACGSGNGSSNTGGTSSAKTIKLESLSGSGVAWKPVSDSYGTAVVILNRSYGQQKVTLLTANAKKLRATGSYVGRAGDGRFVYKFPAAGSAYPSPSTLKVGNRYFNVTNTSKVLKGT